MNKFFMFFSTIYIINKFFPIPSFEYYLEKGYFNKKSFYFEYLFRMKMDSTYNNSPKIEKIVNYYSFSYASYTPWNILDLISYVNYLYIFIIWMPLLFSIFIFFLYLWSYIQVFFFGKIFNIEEKTVNYQNRYSTPFVKGYKGMVDSFYFYSTATKSRFPSPEVFASVRSRLFLWKYKTHVYPFIITLLVLIFYVIFVTSNSWLFHYFLYLTCVAIHSKLNFRFVPMGFQLKHLMVKYKKPVDEIREIVEQKMFFWKRLALIPIFFSFFLFFLTNLLLLMVYLDFFFEPIITWNGYFSKTIYSFFFQGNLKLFDFAVLIPLDYFIALDGLNIWLIWLTALLVFLCSLFCFDWVKTDDFFLQMGWIFFLQFASFQFFCVCNYIWMYIFFELSLLPIYILIIYWGSNRRKIHAAYQMVLFTFIGSLFLLVGILMLYTKIKSFNCFDIFFTLKGNLETPLFSFFEKRIIWLFMFIGFAVKTPLYPFHIWLPEAHSEAPTPGSVLLAGVLLKMGTYGFLRYVLPIFPDVLEYYRTLIYFMCLAGILFSSMSALAQIDIKKIIAYSSIGHMGLVILGICTQNSLGILGASFMMISHGLISGALFFSIGLLYWIYGTRSIVHYSGIAHFMPRFSLCFFIFSLSNMGFPGTAGFPAEILIFSAMVSDNLFLTIFASCGSILGGCYSIWLLTWIIYGQISPKISFYKDLKPIEWKIVITLVFFIIFFGIFPFIIIDIFKPFCVFFINSSY